MHRNNKASSGSRAAGLLLTAVVALCCCAARGAAAATPEPGTAMSAYDTYSRTWKPVRGFFRRGQRAFVCVAICGDCCPLTYTLLAPQNSSGKEGRPLHLLPHRVRNLFCRIHDLGAGAAKAGDHGGRQLGRFVLQRHGRHADARRRV